MKEIIQEMDAATYVLCEKAAKAAGKKTAAEWIAFLIESMVWHTSI